MPNAAACDPPEYDHGWDLTPPHFPDDDPDDPTSCLVCGRADGYGVLHLAEPVDEPAESRLLSCSDCGHVRHSRLCDAAVVRFPGSVPCGCRGEA